MHTKILMVCLGNICRSPVADGIMQSKIDKYKLDIQQINKEFLKYE
jgi:protein-tyrosine phosphatase